MAPSRRDTLSSADDSDSRSRIGPNQRQTHMLLGDRVTRAPRIYLAQPLLLAFSVAILTGSLLLIIIVCLRADASLTGSPAWHSRLLLRLKTASSMC
jgi:hypothetical protein